MEPTTKKRRLVPDNCDQDDDDNDDNNNNPQLSDLLSYPPSFLSKLTERIRASVPDNDTMKFSTRLERLNWANIVFDDYSVEECKKVWLLLQKNVRKYRVLNEIIDDVNQWINNIDTQHIRHQKAPKMPPNAYSLFIQEQYETVAKHYPNETSNEVFKIMAKHYKELPENKKKKYKDLAALKRQQYNEDLQEFYKNHPECVPAKKVAKLHNPPEKPRTPFEVFVNVEHEKHNSDQIDAVFTEECREKWNGLNDEDKMFYINWSQEDYNKYCEDLKTYLQEYPQYKPPKVQVLSKQEKLILERLSGKPIKPPTSAFALFARQLSQKDVLKNVKGGDKMICITEQWHKLTNDEKDQYKIRIEQLWQQYQNDLDEYLCKLPIDQRNELLNDKSYKKLKNKKIVQIRDNKSNKMKKKQPQLKCPETPTKTVFEYFLSVNTDTDEDATTTWQNLSEKQRQIYVNRHNELKRKYIHEYEQFLNSLSKKQLEYFAKYRRVLNEDDAEGDGDKSDC